MDIKATAQKVIDLLNRDGWTQGLLITSDGRRCIFGAFNQVAFGDYHWPMESQEKMGKTREFAAALAPIVDRKYPERIPLAGMHYYDTADQPRGKVVTFNNSVQTSKEDVIGVLQELVNA